MSFVVEIPSVFTKPTQIPVRLGNTILTGNETIQGTLNINSSLILNEGETVDNTNVVYYDSLDISNTLSVGDATVGGRITTNELSSDSYIHSDTTNPITIINNNTSQTGIRIESNSSFGNDNHIGPRTQNLIQWINDTIYGGIYLRSYNTAGTAVYGRTDRMKFGLDFKTRNGTSYITRMSISNVGRMTCVSLTQTSDDRIKKDEQYISNAIETITKLRPQTYNKYETMDCSGDYIFESGLIAQEIYYDVPELRHLVDIDISGHVDTSEDPSIDPDYSNWGSNIASVNYIGIIPYCIQAIKEQQIILKKQKERIETLKKNYNDLLPRIQALEI